MRTFAVWCVWSLCGLMAVAAEPETIPTPVPVEPEGETVVVGERDAEAIKVWEKDHNDPAWLAVVAKNDGYSEPVEPKAGKLDSCYVFDCVTGDDVLAIGTPRKRDGGWEVRIKRTVRIEYTELVTEELRGRILGSRTTKSWRPAKLYGDAEMVETRWLDELAPSGAAGNSPMPPPPPAPFSLPTAEPQPTK